MAKRLRFVKIKCECGHVNLIPVYKTLRIEAELKCERCGKVIVQLKQKKKDLLSGVLSWFPRICQRL